MFLTLSDRLLAGAFVFGALLFAIGSVTWWSRDRYACPVPATGNFWKDTADPEECRLLRRFPDIAQRNGKQLSVTRVSGQPKVFEDAGECWVADGCSFYVLGLVTPDRDVVALWLGADEGSDAVLFDRRSGHNIRLGEFPERSDDGRYWSVVDSSPLGGTNVAQVIQHENGQFNVIAEGDGSFCDLVQWEVAPVFTAICFDAGDDRYEELRFTPDSLGRLIRTETHRVLTPEEAHPY
jgi:hypothetical protein